MRTLFPKRRARGRRSGLAAMEFALMAPLLTTMMVGATDAALVFIAQLQLSSAVSAGAEYVLVNATQVSSTNGATLASNVAAIVGNMNGSGWASGTVVVNNGPTATFSGGASTASGTASSANSYYCLTGSPNNWTWGTAYSSAVACSAGSVNAGKFVTITASYAYTPLMLSTIFASGNLTESVAVQVQ